MIGRCVAVGAGSAAWSDTMAQLRQEGQNCPRILGVGRWEPGRSSLRWIPSCGSHNFEPGSIMPWSVMVIRGRDESARTYVAMSRLASKHVSHAPHDGAGKAALVLR